MTEGLGERTPHGELPEVDILRNYDEAVEWLKAADLQRTVLVLEDRSTGELVARGLLGGGPDRYTFDVTSLEGGPGYETTVDRTEAAEIIGGWTVAGRKSV